MSGLLVQLAQLTKGMLKIAISVERWRYLPVRFAVLVIALQVVGLVQHILFLLLSLPLAVHYIVKAEEY